MMIYQWDISSGAPLTNFKLQNLSTQKNPYYFLHTQKNPLVLFLQPQKIPLFYFATQKNPGIFHRPKKITFGQNFRPKKITRTPSPLSLKYVSGAPGNIGFLTDRFLIQVCIIYCKVFYRLQGVNSVPTNDEKYTVM